MADFLARLASRSLGIAPIAQPLARSRFAPDTDHASSRLQGSQFGTSELDTDFEAAPTGQQNDRPRNHLSPDFFSGHEAFAAANHLAGPGKSDFSLVPSSVASSVASHVASRAMGSAPWKGETPSRAERSRVQPYVEGITLDDDKKEDSRRVNQRDGHNPGNPPGFLVAPARSVREPFASLPGVSAHRESPAMSSSSAPMVKVSIGRVEIRAEFPAAAPKTSSQRSPSLALSLDEYARQRREGKR